MGLIKSRTYHETQEAMSDCLQAYRKCLETAMYCVNRGDAYAKAGYVRLILDCADICNTAVGFMARGSELHGWICGLTADICTRCSEVCSKFEDAELKECSEILSRAAHACRLLAE